MSETPISFENLADKEPFMVRYPFLETPIDASEQVQQRFNLFNRAIMVLNATDVWNANLKESGLPFSAREQDIAVLNDLVDITRRGFAPVPDEPYQKTVATIDDLLSQLSLSNRKITYEGPNISANEEEVFHRLDFIYHDLGPKISFLFLLNDEDDGGNNETVLSEFQNILDISIDTLQAHYPKEQLLARNKFAQAIARDLKDMADPPQNRNFTFENQLTSVNLEDDHTVEYSRVRFLELMNNIVSNAQKRYKKDRIMSKEDRVIVFTVKDHVDAYGQHFIDYEFGNITNTPLPEWLKTDGFQIGESGYREETELEPAVEGEEVISGTGVAMGTNKQILQEQYGGDLLIREEENVDGKGHKGIVTTVRLPVVPEEPFDVDVTSK